MIRTGAAVRADIAGSAVDEGSAADSHLRTLVERLVRDGLSDREIRAAVRAAER